LIDLNGESPLQVKVSRQPVTDPHTAGGNESSEAEGRELLDRNESEGRKPRNGIYYDGRLFSEAGMQHLEIDKARKPDIIGVGDHSMITEGAIRNLGDPLYLPNEHKQGSKAENAESQAKV
jgi:hypothetical protein